ncbi:unnamed protein product [Mytilus edulis]|uniref:TIR domain-containing protein n=1 Tax=Mytilus edulis TaxID=6550 RepID=A0A8S3TRR2_MYTED|nr:unnamed protein product [Mytilus edulis]
MDKYSKSVNGNIGANNGHMIQPNSKVHSAANTSINIVDKKMATEDGKTEIDEEEEKNDETREVVDILTETDFEVKKLELLEKAKKAMKEINNSQHDRTSEGHLTETLRSSILKIYNSYFWLKKSSIKRRTEYRLLLAGELILNDNNTLVIFCELCKTILHSGYRNSEGKPVGAIFKPLKNMIVFLQNITDNRDPNVCKTILEQSDFLKILIQKLHEWKEPHLKQELKENDNILLTTTLGTLHNIAQDEDSIPKLREIGIIEAVQPYIDSSSEIKRLASLAILANVVNEEESRILQSNDDLITFMVKSLKKAMHSKIRRCHGWSVREITRTVRMVARNNVNKRTVVTHGTLPLLVELADQPKYTEEQREAVKALWTLSFDKQNQSEMIENKDNNCVIDIFIRHSKSEDSEVRRTCTKALWTMKDGLRTSQYYQQIVENLKLPDASKTNKATNDSHVMISYNWGHQTIMKHICSFLRNSGIKVWMDIDDMHGSTLQAMATAVEKADIVLVCFSQKYKNSDNCRAEAEYAFQLKKKIIPLKMEGGYKPDGWLGFIIGAKLFYDFSGKYAFENKMKELIKDVQTSLQKMTGTATILPNTDIKVQALENNHVVSFSSTPSAKSTKMTVEIDKIKKWTPQRIAGWLDKNSLPRNLLGRLTGIEIAFLCVLVNESPDMYYKVIGEQLGVKDILTMAKLRFALEVLDTNA